MAAKAKTRTIGEEQADLLQEAIRQLQNAPLEGARDLPVLTGLHLPPKPICTEPQENVLLNAIDHMAASGKIYHYGDDVVYESDISSNGKQSLSHLRSSGDVQSGAESKLANVFICCVGDFQFAPPRWFVNLVLHSNLLSGRLPCIRTYATRSLFDANFQLCSPGWNPGSGVLIHGHDIEPVLHEGADPTLPALERLPTHLRTMLGDFCFRSAADLVNTLAMFLTGLLANLFVTIPKGLFLIDGNQPGLGKTLLVRCLGIILDGVDPRFVTFLADETELEKRLCALLRGRWQSIVFLDNAKVINGAVISSQVVEANSVAPEVSLRVLGTSTNYTRRNDLVWAITMNDTRVSPDLASRGVPIRLAYEGRPEDRIFTGPDPLEYAKTHRLEILGELAGMVMRWNQAGRPRGEQSHRSHEWAGIIGGILTVSGFPEFLSNAGEAAAAFNAQLEELAALAEAVAAINGPFIDNTVPQGVTT